ncbi:hypothetical protein DOTSEDRAFT_74564 [Dothistroma septosporum NZE10]|uniref:SUN domain-containing protein n=1 Tax=Dothistroma septosporum (strain NZE10 / CBS 128990) TaxID=675120 RepID=N1PHP4_DOTSN|nr:hypothetical protein DOTSEDRAFT_74564 [Dothistroma septosporum NZE10]
MGLAQLTVQYPHKIYPDAIYVEHVPASGTHDIAAAPKQFEVWAQMENAAEAARVQEVLDREVNIRYGFECGPPPKHNSLRWVCFASGEYNIHYANHVQKVSTLFDAEEIGLATKMIAFRVKENWGSKDHTCIYRLRMIGKEVGSELRPIV